MEFLKHRLIVLQWLLILIKYLKAAARVALSFLVCLLVVDLLADLRLRAFVLSDVL